MVVQKTRGRLALVTGVLLDPRDGHGRRIEFGVVVVVHADKDLAIQQYLRVARQLADGIDIRRSPNVRDALQNRMVP